MAEIRVIQDADQEERSGVTITVVGIEAGYGPTLEVDGVVALNGRESFPRLLTLRVAAVDGAGLPLSATEVIVTNGTSKYGVFVANLSGRVMVDTEEIHISIDYCTKGEAWTVFSEPDREAPPIPIRSSSWSSDEEKAINQLTHALTENYAGAASTRGSSWLLMAPEDDYGAYTAIRYDLPKIILRLADPVPSFSPDEFGRLHDLGVPIDDWVQGYGVDIAFRLDMRNPKPALQALAALAILTQTRVYGQQRCDHFESLLEPHWSLYLQEQS